MQQETGNTFEWEWWVGGSSQLKENFIYTTEILQYNNKIQYTKTK